MMKTIHLFCVFTLLFGSLFIQKTVASELDILFDGKYGQVEVGSKYAGVEFHHSRPLPSRISFYYPVANSLDLSTNYWKRDESMPFFLVIDNGSRQDSIGGESFEYRYTPYSVTFFKEYPEYHLEVSFDFCEDIPVVVYRMVLENVSEKIQEFKVTSGSEIALRSCHTYDFFKPTSKEYSDDNQHFFAGFDYLDTDSALFFICNAGEKVYSILQDDSQTGPAAFNYYKTLGPKEKLEIVQLVGTCTAQDKENILTTYLTDWQSSISENKHLIEQYSTSESVMVLGDAVLEQTANWSKAVMASNIHYLDGEFVPMPCPAEYNFFFTHDALLTDLGAVHFDLGRVKKDLLYLKSLTKPDSVLPHAYYWKDNRYVTEYCGSDNWNHFWFIILANSYYKHSGDVPTLKAIFPIIEKSIKLVLKNKLDDDLLYGTQPDWWDIGKIFGARSYISLLMIKALQDYAALGLVLEKNELILPSIELSTRMRSKLVDELWDDDKSYFMNMLDTVSMDNHYYAGSLIASAFSLVDNEKSMRQLESARQKLLDNHLGIRNVMPADFHQLIDVYKFSGMEAGEPYVYANGGVWPQGTIWYCLGLIETGQSDKAKEILEKYLTLDGIKNSPNGQPSFYEYRNANADSPEYGKIDKPTFTWAGGWYLYTLYRLMGARENPWNMYLTPSISGHMEKIEYDLTIFGNSVRITYHGNGNYFRSITQDGIPVYSAVMNSPASKIELELGAPKEPYLAKANCFIEKVMYSSSLENMKINVVGIKDQTVDIELISPDSVRSVSINKKNDDHVVSSKKDQNIFTIRMQFKLEKQESEISVNFYKQ